MSQLIPAALREVLVARITEDADEADWDHLSQAHKTAQLSRWVDNPEIGGVLQPLVGGEADLRVWIKEVALKMRSRRGKPTAAEVIGALYQGSAIVEEHSIGFKPHHCVVVWDGSRHYVCWDVDSNARNLFWAAVNSCVDDPNLEAAVVAFIAHGASMTPAHRRKRFEDVAGRCGVRAVWLIL